MGEYDQVKTRVDRGKKTHALLALCTSWRVASDFARTRADVTFRGEDVSGWPTEMVLHADMTKECHPERPVKESRPIPRLADNKSMCPVFWTYQWVTETKTITFLGQ